MHTNAAMQHTDRLVWSDDTLTWVAVPEPARSHTKPGGRARGAMLTAAALFAAAPGWALDTTALLSGSRVVAGQAKMVMQAGPCSRSVTAWGTTAS